MTALRICIQLIKKTFRETAGAALLTLLQVGATERQGADQRKKDSDTQQVVDVHDDLARMDDAARAACAHGRDASSMIVFFGYKLSS